MTDAKKPVEAKEPEPKTYAVEKEFWLGDKLCTKGSEVQLTDSQAKRLGDAVKAAA